MIHTSKQLKDKVRNLSKGDNDIAKTLLRNFMMERFLERVTVSDYRDNFVLKGGMLVASIIGVNLRATMDIDTTVKSISLNRINVKHVVEEICNINLEDNVKFKIISLKEIMEDFEYPGIRVMLEATLDRMRQPVKIDISTDDVITPGAIQYEYKLMFEERGISLRTYNIETLLAEKIQTILVRGIANTRMRDYYDVYELFNTNSSNIDFELLSEAFSITCHKRNTIFSDLEIEGRIQEICLDSGLKENWNRFKEKNYYVEDLNWNDVVNYVVVNIKTVVLNLKK